VTETQTGGAGGSRRAGGSSARPARRQGERASLFARIGLFLRQVVAELKKVVRPTRQELITYTSVVLVFVLAVMLYVSGLDFAFGKLVLAIFGGAGS
jgi:preprotein translocase subunit SecE